MKYRALYQFEGSTSGACRSTGVFSVYLGIRGSLTPYNHIQTHEDSSVETRNSSLNTFSSESTITKLSVCKEVWLPLMAIRMRYRQPSSDSSSTFGPRDEGSRCCGHLSSFQHCEIPKYLTGRAGCKDWAICSGNCLWHYPMWKCPHTGTTLLINNIFIHYYWCIISPIRFWD